MDKVVVDVTASLKTFRITGRMSWLRVIEEETDTWARFKDRTLELPGVRGSVDALRRVVPEEMVEYTPNAKILLEEAEKLARIEEENLRLRSLNQITVEGYEFGGELPPWDHQVKAFMLSRDREVFGLFMEMGTGKTRVVIDTAAYLHEQERIDMCLVIAPNGVHRQWVQKEVPEWMPPRTRVRSWAHRPGRKEPADLYEDAPGELKFYAINIEQLSVVSGKKRLEKLLRSVPPGRALLVVDESSLIKWHRAKRTQAISSLGKLAGYRRILDGLPISKGVHDIYSQFKFLDENIIGVTSYTGFRNRYCRMGGFRGKAILGYKNVGELMGRVRGHTYRVRKEDCLDLPRKMPPVEVWVEMTDEQRGYYEQMKKHFFMELRNGEIVDGTIGAVRLMRMHQVVCGHLPRTKTSDWRPLGSNRIDRLTRLLSQVDGKSIIWCRWVPDIIQITEKLGDSCVEYSGRVNQSDREMSLWKLENDPKTRCLVGQQQSGGVGLNMTAACNTFYFSNHPSLRLRKQSEDRTHRGGQTEVCSYWDLLVPDSPDTLIMDILRNDYDLAVKSLDEEYLRQFI